MAWKKTNIQRKCQTSSSNHHRFTIGYYSDWKLPPSLCLLFVRETWLVGSYPAPGSLWTPVPPRHLGSGSVWAPPTPRWSRDRRWWSNPCRWWTKHPRSQTLSVIVTVNVVCQCTNKVITRIAFFLYDNVHTDRQPLITLINNYYWKWDPLAVTISNVIVECYLFSFFLLIR